MIRPEVPSGAGSVDDPTSATPVYTPADVTTSQVVTLSVSVSDGESATPGTVDVTVSDGAAPPPLLDENFDAGDLSAWTVVDQSTQYSPAAWTASSGALVQTSDAYTLPTDRNSLDKLGTYIWYPAGLSWTDYRLTHALRSQDNDTLGVMFRYQDENNYYRFSWDRQRAYRRLIKRVNGVATLLAEDSVTYVTSQTYAMEIVAQGSNLSVLIDGAPALSATDADLASGSIAFYSWANLNAVFDDVLVEVP